MEIDGHAAHGVSPTATLGILIDDILGFTLWDRRGTVPAS